MHHVNRFVAALHLHVRARGLHLALPRVQHWLFQAGWLPRHQPALLAHSLLVPEGCPFLELLLLLCEINVAAVQKDVEVVDHDCLLLIRHNTCRRVRGVLLQLK